MSSPNDSQARKQFRDAKRQGRFRALLNFFHTYLYINRKEPRGAIEEFHKLYYNSSAFGQTWMDTSWFGVKTWKLPLDLWMYQEILFETQPDIIIETGTAFGGSAYYLAFLCDHLKKGRILTIDIDQHPDRPQHPRIAYIEGSSTSEEVFAKVKGSLRPDEKVMVILDSDHRKEHVLSELKIYAPLVSPNAYLIVEDTNLNGHPVYPEWGPGPMEALEEFLKENRNFEIDKSREKLILTFNPNGYLRKRI